MTVVWSVFFLFSCSSNEGSKSAPELGDTKTMEKMPHSLTGIDFRNDIQETWELNDLAFNYMYNGAGTAIGDIDHDGWSDVYFVGNMKPNKLYKNKGGFVFEDVTQKAGVAGDNEWSTGCVMADINGDGWLDIYVTRGGWGQPESARRNLLYINQKNGTFKEAGAKWGIDDPGFSIASVFFDMDNDGDLDLYITNRPKEFHHSVAEDLEGRKKASVFERDHLYRNEGDGHFADISEAAGISKNNYGYGLGVVSMDMNNDGFVDIYVSNDFIENDYCYLNNGDGTFRQAIREVTSHVSFYSMGVDASDLNNDKYEEIIATEMLPEDYWRAKVTMAPMMSPKEHNFLFEDGHFHYQYMHNSVQLNRGNGTFSEIANYCGLKHTDWSWAVLGVDFDNDGWRDVFVANGYLRDIFDNDAKHLVATKFDSLQKLRAAGKPIPDVHEVLKLYPSNPIHNYIFRNNGNLKFTDQSLQWGLEEKTFSNGAAVGDLDNDGDLDLVINNLNGFASVYRNNVAQGHRLRLRLEGASKNTFGLGAKVFVYSQGFQLFEEFKTVRGYVSSVEPILHFGLGETSSVDSVVVHWPDGRETTVLNPPVDKVSTISYQNAKKNNNLKRRGGEVNRFENISDNRFMPPYLHKENRFDDFKAQVLLPHRHSEQSPVLAVGDVNGDHLEDVYVGGSLLQAGVLYLQDKTGHFIQKKEPLFERDKDYEDGGADFLDVDGDGDLDLYVSSGGIEHQANNPMYQDRLYLNDGKGVFYKKGALPEVRISGSCVKVADYDKDGDPDVFVGGRIVPEFYPYAPNSFVLTNEKGKLVPLKLNTAFDKVGMVTDAQWADLNADNKLDLVLVGEWMPITVFLQVDTGFVRANDAFGTAETEGWWNRIAKGDLDGDGDVDFVVGNIGENYKFKASREKPFHIYAADFDKDGTYDPYLVKNYHGKMVPVRGRQCSSQELNFIKDKFPSYRAFAKADVKDILGDEMKNSLHLMARKFSSVALINEGGHFRIVDLPLEAQLSWVTGIVLDDYNHDGKTDVLLAGNMYEPEPETTRADAFVGCLLLNKGDGVHYDAISGPKCGFFVRDNVRDMKSLTLGAKEKSVLIGINEGPLKVFKYVE